MSRPSFKILKKSRKSRARLGVIETEHGVLHTPAFFPVATQGAVKTLDSQDLEELGFEGILANTYHLMLRPGSKVIQKRGGLREFCNFKGVIATDSGGFQVFSLGKGLEQKIGKFFNGLRTDLRPLKKGAGLVKIREEGVWFKSHLDGSEQFLSPEKSMQIQQELGADIIFAFDECASPLDDFKYNKKAMERTHHWAVRCLKQRTAQMSNVKSQMSKLNSKTKNFKKQMLFGIIQGGKYKTLRQASAKFIGSLDFDGFGIGGSFGRSYGHSKKNMLEVLDWTMPLLPQEKPRHLLGIGHLADLEACVKKGVDLFDCVHPTRLARHGVAIVSKNKTLNLNKAIFLKDKKPLLANCHCPACQNYSRSYLCHLLRAGEPTAQRLLTLHNLYFFKNFMDNMRERIKQGKM